MVTQNTLLRTLDSCDNGGGLGPWRPARRRIVETIFAWPGMGRLVVQALDNRDFPLVQGVLVMAISYVGVNILVDLLYSIVDPRIRCN